MALGHASIWLPWSPLSETTWLTGRRRSCGRHLPARRGPQGAPPTARPTPLRRCPGRRRSPGRAAIRSDRPGPRSPPRCTSVRASVRPRLCWTSARASGHHARRVVDLEQPDSEATGTTPLAPHEPRSAAISARRRLAGLDSAGRAASAPAASTVAPSRDAPSTVSTVTVLPLTSCMRHPLSSGGSRGASPLSGAARHPLDATPGQPPVFPRKQSRASGARRPAYLVRYLAPGLSSRFCNGSGSNQRRPIGDGRAPDRTLNVPDRSSEDLKTAIDNAQPPSMTRISV